MRIEMTLSEIFNLGNWEKYCEKTGCSVWAINEGGGHIEKSFNSFAEAFESGALNPYVVRGFIEEHRSA